MTEQEYLLTCLAEESAELAQAASKALRFGLFHVWPGRQQTNIEALRDELRDVLRIAERIGIEPGGPDKGDKFDRMMQLSRDLGKLI